MKHFDISEFNCKCCGMNNMNVKTLEMLDLARSYSGVSYIILSGYRCPKHNIAEGSISLNHVQGRAADIKALTNQIRGKILRGLYKAGFKRVGLSIMHGYIHADTMNDVECFWCNTE
jgi:uncharacterized protein YcbK (DUF882 family)